MSDMAVVKYEGDAFALVAANPVVHKRAETCGVEPQALIVEITRHLAAKLDREVSLAVGQVAIRPEPFAEVLAAVSWPRQLIDADLEDKSVGINLVSSRATLLNDLIEKVLELAGLSEAHEGIELSLELATKFVQRFNEEAVEMAEEILAKASRLRDFQLFAGVGKVDGDLLGAAIEMILEEDNDRGVTVLPDCVQYFGKLEHGL